MCCARPSDVRLDAGHAAVEPGPVAACARGPRCCHIAHWLRGSGRDHVGHHGGLLLRVEHLLVDMANMLVVEMLAVVAEGERQRHALLIELVGGTSLWHACDSRGGGISLRCARSRLDEGVVRGTIGEETLGTPWEGQRGVQAVVVGGRRRGGAAAAERTVGAHGEDIGVGSLVQGQFPISVGQAQPPQVGVLLL